MNNVLILAFPQEWDASEILSFLEARNCKLSVHHPDKPVTEDYLISLIRGVDGIITGSHPYTRRVISAADNLKIISRTGAGFDSIDLEAATERGIIVTTTPDANSESVAELAMGLMLAVARQIPQGDRDIRRGGWSPHLGVELYQKTLGIIGLGKIGKRLAKRAYGFDMTILAHDLYQDEAFAAQYGVTYLPLEELLARADFVSIHSPLSPETSGLIGERVLKLMKPTAYLINTARGSIVHEASLIKALNSGWIAGAGLDVFSQEPPTNSPLLSIENVVLGPHVAASTEEAMYRMARGAAENVVKVFEGKQPLGIVNTVASG